jgi:hypothetical protein
MMEDILVLNKSDIIIDKKVRTNFNRNKVPPERIIFNPVIDNLIVEGGESFFHYLNWLGLADEPNMLVLSSRYHYYGHNDLKGVTTLINLKKLNLIKHLDSFLHVVCNVLSPKANFIGRFSDKRIQNSIEPRPRIFKRRNSFFESKIYFEIDKIDVSRLLESHGLKVMDLTDINGLTYFRAQNS